jgi:tryptophanyl-tRNA synthetase
MGGANVDSCILLTDTPQMVSDKINKYAKSGGGATLEEHRSKGADLNVDIPYQWLRFFLEDDEELLRIGTSYKKGEMTTGEIKAILIKVIQ